MAMSREPKKMEVPIPYIRPIIIRPIFWGISPQKMAKHMVLTYLHLLEPEDLPLIWGLKTWENISEHHLWNLSFPTFPYWIATKWEFNTPFPDGPMLLHSSRSRFFLRRSQQIIFHKPPQKVFEYVYIYESISVSFYERYFMVFLHKKESDIPLCVSLHFFQLLTIVEDMLWWMMMIYHLAT
jgi:hypothetical protein